MPETIIDIPGIFLFKSSSRRIPGAGSGGVENGPGFASANPRNLLVGFFLPELIDIQLTDFIKMVAVDCHGNCF